MKKTDIIQLLEKYKNNLPFEYETFYSLVLDGNIDALIYMSFLNKHDCKINMRNMCKTPVLTYKLDEFVDSYCIPDRMRFIKLSDSITYFAGFG